MSIVDSIRISNPLPRHYLTEEPGLAGQIKQRPEDFIVEELPLYEPIGEGEHLYIRVQKIGVSHGELMATLRKHFGVPERSIGYAGMKDKHAVTRQTLSIHMHEEPASLDIDHRRIQILWSDRHRNKIKRGHLAGNRFVIKIRESDPIKTPLVARTLRRLERQGVPAYFGSQRFGYRANNHLLGILLMHADWRGILDEMLGSTGTPFPEHQRERRELYDAGRFEEAARHWTTADRSELIAIRALSQGKTAQEAVAAIGRTTLNFWTSSTMSAAFNRVLDRRIEDGTVDRLLEGDLAFLHTNRAVFDVTAEELATGLLEERLASFEISPSGPLWGHGIKRAFGDVGVIEEEALAATGLTLDQISETAPYRPDGGRRPLRSPIRNVEVEGGFDDDGPYIQVAFDLPRGMYATIALREILKDAGDAGDDAD